MTTKKQRNTRSEQILTTLLTEVVPTRRMGHSIRRLHDLLIYEREGLSGAARRARLSSRG